jgi:hypothetical protein
MASDAGGVKGEVWPPAPDAIFTARRSVPPPLQGRWGITRLLLHSLDRFEMPKKCLLPTGRCIQQERARLDVLAVAFDRVVATSFSRAGIAVRFRLQPPTGARRSFVLLCVSAYWPLHSADDTPAKFTRAPGETSSTRYRWRPLLVGSSTRRRVIWDTICNQVIILRITNTPTTSMPFEKPLVLTHNRELPRSIE